MCSSRGFREARINKRTYTVLSHSDLYVGPANDASPINEQIHSFVSSGIAGEALWGCMHALVLMDSIGKTASRGKTKNKSSREFIEFVYTIVGSYLDICNSF